jgi:hypothetical protein
MRHLRSLVFVAALIVAAALAGSSSASGPVAASCTGQFFSSHAGSATQGVTVGGFISETAQELGAGFGQTIAGARELPRANCGL